LASTLLFSRVFSFIFDSRSGTLNTANCTISTDYRIVSEKWLGNMWQGVVLTKFLVLSRYLRLGAAEYSHNKRQSSPTSGGALKPALPENGVHALLRCIRYGQPI
jgi:hypothetical protein